MSDIFIQYFSEKIVTDEEFKSLFTYLSKLEQCEQIDSAQLKPLAEIKSISGPLNALPLSFMPKTIKYLTNLQQFVWWANDLEELPDELMELSNLKTIFVFSNNIKTISEKIGNLVNLKHLVLASEHLQSLPDSITFCNNLEILQLIAMPLVSLPEKIGNLSQLLCLWVSRCNLRSLPKSITELSELTYLDISKTPISELPDGFSKLVNLQKVDLRGTLITRLPEELLDLPGIQDGSVRFNTQLLISEKSGIEEPGIYLSESAIVEPPLSLLETNNLELIREWYRNHSDKVSLREGKVIFLGDGGVGKTYTINRIQNAGKLGDFETQVTSGVEIEDVHVEIRNVDVELDFSKDKTVPFTIHYWDFGGQAIMRSMHRVFMTDRTVYVVVISNRYSNLRAQARYWLKNIESFAQNVPVILAVNQWDGVPSINLDTKSLEEEFPNLRQVVLYSAKTEDEEEFQQLTDTINSLVAEMSRQNHQAIPKEWYQVQNEILKMQGNYIDQTQYNSICSKQDIPEGMRSVLLEWFNQLGTCFSYHLNPLDQTEFSDYKVLKPKWLTNAIYILITGGREYAKRGILSHEDIWTLLQKSGKGVVKDLKYQEDEINYILSIMEKFRLAYAVDRKGNEFIPALCSEERPDDLAPSYANHSAYELSYRYLPDSILHQLMIDCYDRLNQDMLWSRGLRIDDSIMTDEGLVSATAIVSLNNDDEHLRIDLYSDSSIACKTLLGYVWNKIVVINQVLGLSVLEENIIFFRDNLEGREDVDILLEAKEDGDTNIRIRMEEKGNHRNTQSMKVKVDEILDAVFDLNQIERLLEEKGNLEQRIPIRNLFTEQRDMGIQIHDDIVQSMLLVRDGFDVAHSTEAELSSALRSMLSMKYEVYDQAMQGRTLTSKYDSGNVDLAIYHNRRPYAALEISRFSSLRSHLHKVVNQIVLEAERRSLPYSYLLIPCFSDRFEANWEWILGYLNAAYAFGTGNTSFDIVEFKELPDLPYSNLRSAKLTLSNGKRKFILYIIAAHIRQ